MLALLVLIVILWLVLQTSFVQNFIVKKVTKRLSKELNTTVSIKHIDFEFFDKLLLQGTLVLDHNRDTLLYAGAVKVNITDWFFFKNDITLKYIGLDDAVINLNRKDSVWNYQFLADYFSGPPKKKDTTASSIKLSLKQVQLKNVKLWQQDQWVGTDMLVSVKNLKLNADTFDLNRGIVNVTSLSLDHPLYTQYDYNGNRPEDTTIISATPAPLVTTGLRWNTDGWKIAVNNINIEDGGVIVDKQTDSSIYSDRFDDQHIFISGINGTLKGLHFIGDTLKASLDLSAQERSGFVIKRLTSHFKFTPTLMEFNQLDLQTNRSHLTNYYAMHYHDFNHDMLSFIHAVKLEGRFQNSNVSSDDLAFFAPEAASWKEDFMINGNVKGSIDNLTAKDMTIKAGAGNYLEGDVSLRGLPDINQLFIDFRAKEFRTNYQELARLIPDLKTISSPNLSAFGHINFKGSFTGFIRDFVTYGTLSTDIGTLTTDLQMKLPAEGTPVYSGKVSTNNFQLGRFINSSQIGAVAFDGKINGSGFSAKDVDVGIDGRIRMVTFNGYAYTNIIAHGNFKKRLFLGTASIDDPNVRIDSLTGSINFSSSEPEINLSANVGRLNLKDLGFTKDSISLTGNFNLDFTGSNIDNFLGSAKLYNAILLDKEKHLSFDSLVITSSIEAGEKRLSLQTNELEATLTGNFKMLELPNAFQLFLNRYYPAYIGKPTKKIENQDFSFLIKTKNISDYVTLFEKRLTGFNNAVIEGDINVAKNILNVQAYIPGFSYSTISFDNIHFTGIGTRDTLAFNGDIDDVVINDSLHAPDTKISIVANNDISDVNINTSANKTLNAANLSATVKTNANGFNLKFNPSVFTINEKQWTIAEGGQFGLDKKTLTASNVKFYHDGQEIDVSTEPSSKDSSNDVLIGLKKLDIGDFAPIFIKTPKLNGFISGNVRISDIFNKRLIAIDTRTDQFRLEDDSVGVLLATGEYRSGDETVKLHAVSNNSLYNFFADFGYNIKDTTSDQLSGLIALNNSGIHILGKYLDGIFSDVQGRATGELHLSGKASDAKLTGKVKLDSTSLTVDYTQCRYILANNSILTFNPDEIDFGTLKIYDTLNNTATVSGKIYHSFFNNFFFNNLHLKTDARTNGPAKFVLLNTTSKDNNEFYGNLIGEAEMSLNGFATDMKMDISGQPTDSSHIYLPTGQTAETGSLDYIEFTKFGREMKADLSTHESSNIKVNMTITANPYAKIDVILDETTGDVIKAQGSGKLNISAGTTDDLTISGRYDVASGQYTFNFQTFLKTPFALQDGYIEWQGDPYLANLNIDAVYRATNVDLNNIPSATPYVSAKGDVDIIFKLTGTLKDPEPAFEFKFPFDNPLKSDPIATEYLKTFQTDQNELNRQVTSLLLFNTFMNSQQGLLTGNNTGNFVTRSVGQILSSTLTSSLNNWLQKLLNTNSINLYTNINTADFNFQKGASQKEIQNVGSFGVKTAFLNNRLLLNLGGNVDYKLGQSTASTNSNFLFTPDASFEYLISPDGRLRVIGFNHSDADIGDFSGVTRRNRTGIQLSYRKDFDTFAEFFTNERKKRKRLAADTTSSLN